MLWIERPYRVGERLIAFKLTGGGYQLCNMKGDIIPSKNVKPIYSFDLSNKEMLSDKHLS